MDRRTLPATWLAAALIGCGGQRVPAASRHLPADIATPPTSPGLLRVARTGGTAELLQPGTLAPREWIVTGGLPTISRILGASGADDQTVYAADNNGRLIAIDLQNRRTRTVSNSVRQLASAPDGTIFGVDSIHRPVRYSNRQFVPYKASLDKNALLMRGPGDQLLVLGNRPNVLQVLTPNGEARQLKVPAGRVGATWIGDQVSVTTDSGVIFIDPAGVLPNRFIKLRGNPTLAAFSPSGHRLYVARKKGGLAVVDRFSKAKQPLRELALPGLADGMRVDRTGRWLLAHAAVGDSTWVVDLSSWKVVATENAPWSDDLPQIIDGRTLLLRRHNDLVAIDLTLAQPAEKGVLVGGGGDLYIMLPWVPKSAGTTSAAIAAADRLTGPDTPGAPGKGAAAAPPPPNAATPAAPATLPPPVPQTPVDGPPAPVKSGDAAAEVYIQVSSSQNQDWAKASAKQLKDVGYPAKVLDPKTPDQGYRVVIGPYASRADADAVGKRLGRSYFIITPGSGDT